MPARPLILYCNMAIPIETVIEEINTNKKGTNQNFSIAKKEVEHLSPTQFISERLNLFLKKLNI